MNKFRRDLLAVGVPLTLGHCLGNFPQALAQSFPSKPVKVLIGFSAGSEVDTVGRLVTQKIAESLGHQFVVENKTGAGGTIAASAAASAQADGYTLLVNSVSHAGVQALYPKLTYDPVKDFAGISQLTSAPNVLLVSPTLGVRTALELVSFAKQRAGGLNFGSAGVGSGTHMTLEQLRLATGINLTHVPYKGVPEVMTDTMAGRVHTCFAPIGNALNLIRDGKLLALAVSTSTRSPVLAQTPTLEETVAPGLDWDQWYGFFAPSKTPRPIIELLSRETAKALALPEIRDRLVARGSVPKPSAPDQFDQFVRDEVAKVSKVIRDGNIRIDS
jgi:tripartite-type tricarboxylate transporter receptor subunit TctC